MVVARVEVDAGRTVRSTAKDDDDQRRDDLWCLQAQDACLLACFWWGIGARKVSLVAIKVWTEVF
jgi:hypothetical protein